MDTPALIKKYYDSFNKQDMQTFISLLDENIIHDINQSGREIGKTKFNAFMTAMNQYYKENISDLVIMTNADGTRAAAEFIVEGTYHATAAGLPAANGQRYRLPCGAFFEIKAGKITRVTTYYNLKEWLNQVQG